MDAPAGAVPPPPSAAPGNPSEAVKVPAIILMVVAGLSGAWQVLSVLLNVLGVGLGAVGSAGNPDMPEWAGMMSGVVGILLNVAFLVKDGIILFGALQMKGLKSYGLAMAVSILSIIPCLSPCCVLGIPFGIWALLVLLKPEVKAAFR